MLEARVIHQIRADIMLPEVRRDLEAILQAPGLVRDDVHVAALAAPEPERALLLHERFERGRLVRREGRLDLLHGDLDPVRADTVRARRG